MASVTVGFSIPDEDQARLEHLVERFGQGNRSAFLRLAMKHMEVLERAEQLRALQTFGVQHRTEIGLDDIAVEDVVNRVLSGRSAG